MGLWSTSKVYANIPKSETLLIPNISAKGYILLFCWDFLIFHLIPFHSPVLFHLTHSGYMSLKSLLDSFIPASYYIVCGFVPKALILMCESIQLDSFAFYLPLWPFGNIEEACMFCLSFYLLLFDYFSILPWYHSQSYISLPC